MQKEIKSMKDIIKGPHLITESVCNNCLQSFTPHVPATALTIAATPSNTEAQGLANLEVSPTATHTSNNPSETQAPAPTTATNLPTTGSLFVGNVGSSHSTEEIRQFIGNSLKLEKDQVEVLLIRTVDKVRTFKVTVPYDQVNNTKHILDKSLKGECHLPSSIRFCYKIK